MHQTKISQQLRQAPRLLKLVEKADAQLDEIMERPVLSVTAEWDRLNGPGNREQVLLRLTDADTGTVSAALNPEELEDIERSDDRLSALYRKLLQVANNVLLERLHAD